MSLCVPHFIYYHYFCSPLNNFYSIKINQASVIKTLLMHKISFELSYNTSPHYLCPSSLSSPRDWKSDLRCIPVWSAFMSYGQLYHTKETKSQTKQKALPWAWSSQGAEQRSLYLKYSRWRHRPARASRQAPHPCGNSLAQPWVVHEAY